MIEMKYKITSSGWHDLDIYKGVAGETLYSQRECLIDALKQNGLGNLPFGVLIEHDLDAICISQGIYVKFVEDTDE